MKKISLFFLLLAYMTNSYAQTKDYSQFVNPMIGTGGHGHTFPGATVPFGMVQVSPDTRLTGWDGCSGYHYSDSIVYGFSHTHLSGTGCSDYGDILLMPFTGRADLKKGISSEFSHKDEKASPGYYRTKLLSYNILAEVTATTRTATHRYIFPPEATQRGVLIDLIHRDKVMDSWVEIVNNHEIRGMRVSKAWAREQTVFFDVVFDTDFTVDTLYEGGKVISSSSGKHSGKALQLVLYFSPNDKQELISRVAISGVSPEGAALNLEKENPMADFEVVRNNAREQWNKELSKIDVKGGTKEEESIFYSALYHAFLQPNVYMDVDGQYRGTDLKIHQATNFTNYSVFSLWDTYRAEHPLLNIIDKKRSGDFVNTFLNMYKNGGLLPVWELSGNETFCMIGYHSVPVITDAWRTGIRNFDYKLAIEAMCHSANSDRYGLRKYNISGLLQYDDEPESVSKTLEYSFDNWCIATMMSNVLKSDPTAAISTDSIKEYTRRSQSWRNLMDPETKFIRPRQNGGFYSPFKRSEVNINYTEANGWQYGFYVPHDVAGHIALMGGAQAYADQLDSLFTTKEGLSGRDQSDITGLIGQYAHGNEPSHHIIYLYNYAGQPWKAQERLHQVMTTLYHNDPDGLSGNEDCGQMSAWLVMSAMGFYEVCPGSGEYALGSPLFDQITIHLENGKQFVISKDHPGADNYYSEACSWNDQPLERPFITYEQIENGGRLVFASTAARPTRWGGNADMPPAILPRDWATVPAIKADALVFTDKLKVTLQAGEDGDSLEYQIGRTQAEVDVANFFQPYQGPFEITETSFIRAMAKRNNTYSAPADAVFNKIFNDKTITLMSQYSPQYTAGGDKALVDGFRGTPNWRTGHWQGYPGDFEAIIDLFTEKDIHEVAIGMLQDAGAWIMMPSEVSFEVSNDKKTWKSIGTVKNTVSDRDEVAQAQDLSVKANVKCRYVRVKAKNYGILPEWHLGSGGHAWIFTDEVIVK